MSLASLLSADKQFFSTGKLVTDKLEVQNDCELQGGLVADGAIIANDGVDVVDTANSQTARIASSAYQYDGQNFINLEQELTGDTITIATLQEFNPNVVSGGQTLDILPNATSIRYSLENPTDFAGVSVRLPFQNIAERTCGDIWVQNLSPTQAITLRLYDQAGATSAVTNFRQIGGAHTRSANFTLNAQQTVCIHAFRAEAANDDIDWNYFIFP